MDAFLAECPARIFDEWEDYRELEPFGPLEDLWRFAVLGILTSAPWRKEGAGPVDPAEWFPQLKALLPEAEPASVEESVAFMRGLDRG